MTESALEKARREAHAGICACYFGGDCQRKAAIARLEAAARLAGRLEQAECSILLADGQSFVADANARLREERDRLRAEAEKEIPHR